MNLHRPIHFGQLGLAATLLLLLGACGGAGDAGSGQSVSRSGQVYLQKGVADAQVCVDLQGSGVCSANAASTRRSSADGSFTISFQAQDDAAAQRFLAAPLIAEITTRQAGYTLSAPATQGDQINPLTTLVQSHIQRTRASLADAQQAVAQQLGIEIGQIYDYKNLDANIGVNARTAALMTELGLEMGTPMRIHAAGDAPDASPRLTSFNYKDADNYDSYLYQTDGIANSNGQLLWKPTYAGLIAGLPRTLANASLSAGIRNTAAYSGREEYLRSLSNPARMLISTSNESIEWLPAKIKNGLKEQVTMLELALTEIDISNMPMADFVKDTQDYESETPWPIEHSLFTLDAQLLGTAVFPPGSRLYRTLRTHFASIPEPVATSGIASSTRAIIVSNDLPTPAALLGGYKEPLRLQQSINATAWNGMKAALDIR